MSQDQRTVFNHNDFDDDLSIGTLVAFQAFSQRFKRLFKMELPLVVDDNPKGAIRKSRGLTQDSDDSLYPFAHVSITSTGLKPDSHVAKLIALYSSGYSTDPESSNTVTTNHYVFWSETTFEFTAEFQDYVAYINFVDKLSIVLASKKLSTGVAVGGEEFTVIISGEPQISLNKATREDEARPSVFTINHTIQVYSRIGQLVDVPKINNEGRITTNVSTNSGEKL